MQQNQYILRREADRSQILNHYFSSLQEPTLDNVESQLEITRKRNYELGASYFQKKYGNSAVYDKMMKEMGLEIPKQAQPSYDRSQFRENQKQYEEYLRKMLHQKQVQLKAELANKPIRKVKVENDNPWNANNTKKNKQKQQQYVWEFKKFRQNKQNRQHIKSPQNQKSAHHNKPKRNYRKDLIIKIFHQIDHDNRGFIEKLAFLEYLTENPKLYSIFDLPQDNTDNVYKYKTSKQEVFSKQQLLAFLGQDHQAEQFQQKAVVGSSVSKGCLLSAETFDLFQKIFKTLDKHSDLIVKRKDLIKKIRQNIFVKKILLTPAIYEDNVNRTILLYRILDKIEEEEYVGSVEDRKLRQYLTFNQFKSYFEANNKEEIDQKIKFIDYLQNFNKNTVENILEVPEEVLAILDTAFQRVEKVSKRFFNTMTYLELVKNDTRYQQNKETTVRRRDQVYGLQEQNFQTTLNRIGDQAHEFIQFSELLEYFSRVGRPKQYYKNMLNQQKKISQNLRASRVLEQQFKHMKENNQIPGYDSDPEIYNDSYIKKSRVREANKAHSNTKPLQKDENKFGKTFASVVQSQKNEKDLQKRHSMNKFEKTSYQPKITIPEPFSFTNKYQHNKTVVQQPAQEKQQRFKAQPPPKKYLQVGLYDKMIQEQEKRRQEVRLNSMVITLATQKPFSFQARQKTKPRRKNNYEREEFLFKAKPVPWFCSVDLFKKYTEQEAIVRKQKISKMAQESLALSKLPPRMEKDELEKKAKKLRQGGDYQRNKQTFEARKAKPPPDFERLQKSFEQSLQRKKNASRPTQIKPFKFSQTGNSFRAKSINVLNTIREFQDSPKKEDPVEKARKLREKQPNIKAASTLKFDQQVEKRRKQIEKKKQQEEQKKRQAQTLSKKQSLKPRLMKSDAMKPPRQTQIEKKLQQKKKQDIEQKKRFQEWKQQRLQNAKAQPLLIQRPLKRDEQLERMKKLALISQTLDQNGVKGKQKQILFTKEELNLLKDYDYLKKNKMI